MSDDPGIEIRPCAGPEELVGVLDNDLRAFASDMPRDRLARLQAAMLGDGRDVRVAVEGGEVVANAATVALELTVPGGATVPAAGVTWVGVSPTHRRRGLMRGVVEQMLQRRRGMGDVVAVLHASEATIYGNVGFGAASWAEELSIDLTRAALLAEVTSTTTLRFVDRMDAPEVLAPIYERARLVRAGGVSRADWFWQRHVCGDPEGDLSVPYVVVHPDGYLRYRTRERWSARGAAHLVHVDELVALSEDARRSLWGFLCDLDLASEAEVQLSPLGDDLPWMLTDPRAVAVTARADDLWLRVLDVPGALGTRRYGTDEPLVIEVTGDDPAIAGRWRIEPRSGRTGAPTAGAEVPGAEVSGAEVSGAEVSAAPDLEADVKMPPSCLGSLLLGGVHPATLARTGRLEELRTGAIAVLADLFVTSEPPFCGTPF